MSTTSVESAAQSAVNELFHAFESPSAEHTACPFWFWNGDMNPDEIVRQIREMYNKNVRSFVLHARAGLLVNYLSEEWFDRCGVAIREAAALGMKVWLYDEDNWPSGYAGGRVLERNPDFIAQNLDVERHYVEGPTSFHLDLSDAAHVRAVSAVRIAEVHPIKPHPLAGLRGSIKASTWSDPDTNSYKYGKDALVELASSGSSVDWDVPEGRWCIMIFKQRETRWIPAYADCYHADMLNGNAVDAFIDVTHEEYYSRFKEFFGSTVLGFFVDEPGLYNNFWGESIGSISWTHDFAEQFEKRRSYSIVPLLPHMWDNLGDRTNQIRFDYWLTVSELARERFFRKLGQWCEDHGVMLTGHLHLEEFLFTLVRTAGHPFMALESFHLPGVDRIDEEYEKLSEKLVSSIAHAHGRRRVLSETFANIGWKLSPSYMKSIVDYQYIRGINLLNPHAFFYSIDDYRKFECPPSEFFQNPWWEHSRPLWDYVARLSAVMSVGEHVAPIALYYPIEDTWCRMEPAAPAAFPEGVGQVDHSVRQNDIDMIALNNRLLENQYDFDFIDYSVLESAGVDAEGLKTGSELFRVVLAPPLEAIVARSLCKFLSLARVGGTVVFVNTLPTRVVEGVAPEEWAGLTEELSRFELPDFVDYGRGRIGFVPQGIDAVVALLRQILIRDVEVEITTGPRLEEAHDTIHVRRNGRVHEYQHFVKYVRRHHGDTDVYFIVNESDNEFSARVSMVGGPAVEVWYPESGDRRQLESSVDSFGMARLELTFKPHQSYLLVLTPNSASSGQMETTVEERKLTDWGVEIDGRRLGKELCSWSDMGMPWYSGTGTYRSSFEITELPETGKRVELDLGTVLETAAVTVNGRASTPMAWGPYVLDITDHLRIGTNELEIEVSNTNANSFQKQERASGLFGPVRLLTREVVHCKP